MRKARLCNIFILILSLPGSWYNKADIRLSSGEGAARRVGI